MVRSTMRLGEQDRGGAAMNDLSGLDVFRTGKLGRILDVARILGRPTELANTLYQMVDAAKDLLDAEGGSVWRFVPATHELETVAAHGLGATRVPADQGLLGECLRTRALINVPDCYADPRFDRSVDRASGFRTRGMMTLPLIGYDDQLVGVLQVVNPTDGVFDPADETVAKVFATLCAVALQRAHLTERLVQSERVGQEIEVAREVQMGTLPKAPPAVAGYDMAGTFRPADETGGDTYDFVPTPDGGVMVLMGDATGHGIGPALSATEVRAMLRVAQRLGAGLDDTFRHINDQLVADLPDDRFVTAFLGHLDPATNTLRYHSGGQGPLLHFHAADRRCDSYLPTTAPLGAMLQVTLSQPRTIEMAPGDVFALLSDGVYEYHDPDGQEFGEAAVIDLLRRHHDEPMAQLRDRLLRTLAEFGRGAPQLDDISIVLIRRVAATAAARSPLNWLHDFERSFDALDDMLTLVRHHLVERGLGEGDCYAVSVAVEELFTNMVKYNPDGTGPIGLQIECTDAELTCRLSDPDSEPFDVTQLPDADVELPVEQRVPGGLGIHLVRRLVDSIDYDYSGRRSRLTFRKTLAASPPRAAASGHEEQQLTGQSPAKAGESTMFAIGYGVDGTIAFSGRLDAAQCAKAQEFIDAADPTRAFDFAGLEYISSAGLGVLLKTHKRLLASGGRLRLVNVNRHIYDIFRFSGFDQVFDVQRVAD
jgi:phosphoserine phosphatase